MVRPAGMAFADCLAPAPATGDGQIEPRWIATASQTKVGSADRQIRAVAPMTTHASEHGVRMGRGKVLNTEMTGQASLRSELSPERTNLDYRRFFPAQPRQLGLDFLLVGRGPRLTQLSFQSPDAQGDPPFLVRLPFRPATSEFHQEENPDQEDAGRHQPYPEKAA
jgi:hypothetical protein